MKTGSSYKSLQKFLLADRKNGAQNCVWNLCSDRVHVVVFDSLCWCVSDCIGTAIGALFLFDIALAFYYVSVHIISDVQQIFL
jgi:hypothetical protein